MIYGFCLKSVAHNSLATKKPVAFRFTIKLEFTEWKEKNQRNWRKPLRATTNNKLTTHIILWHWNQESKLGHIGGSKCFHHSTIPLSPVYVKKTYQRFVTVWLRTQKAFLMPVLSTDIHIFSAGANRLLAILTVIGKLLVIALDASWLSINCHKFLICQGLVAEVTAEVTWMPVLLHGLRVFPNIDQLWKNKVTQDKAQQELIMLIKLVMNGLTKINWLFHLLIFMGMPIFQLLFSGLVEINVLIRANTLVTQDNKLHFSSFDALWKISYL